MTPTRSLPGTGPDKQVMALAPAQDLVDMAAVDTADSAPEFEILIPLDDIDDPEISIVIPAVNEELCISDFVAWCHEGLQKAGARGEILIVDSSSDRTPELALAAGARVLRTPKRGLGRAYIDAIPHIRGQYVIMGDADCTYDFRNLDVFVQRLREGYEMAMGSRWLGSIEAGSMPALHQYFGTPVTTWILNRIYGSKFTDIHCGMRGVSRDALERMGLASQSWEYASEMVLKSVRMDLKTTEVPVTFYKDRDGRVSHHKRSGWFSPFQAAWINLRAMFVYRAEFFAMKPGLAFLVAGLIITLPLTFGTITIGSLTFNLYWMLLGVTLAVLGLQSFYFGCLAQVLCDYSDKSRIKWTGLFRYTPTVLASIGTFALGFLMAGTLAVYYFTHGFSVPSPRAIVDHLAVTGSLLLIMSFQTFCFTLLLNATGVKYGSSSHSREKVRDGSR